MGLPGVEKYFTPCSRGLQQSISNSMRPHANNRFSRLDTVPACDRHTHRWTLDDSNKLLNALRCTGKNRC